MSRGWKTCRPSFGASRQTAPATGLCPPPPIPRDQGLRPWAPSHNCKPLLPRQAQFLELNFASARSALVMASSDERAMSSATDSGHPAGAFSS